MVILMPRTECAYLSIRRSFHNRRPTRRQDNYMQASRSLHSIREKSKGLQQSRHRRDGSKAFLRQSERHYDQVKDPSVIPYNLRLKELAQNRDWRAALSCINEIKKKGLKPDEISYATAIDACSKALKSKPAVALFEEMKNVGIQPNVPIYNAVMNACARDNQWRQSLGYLEDMQSNGVVPNIVSYNVCLSALEKSKKWIIAIDLMKKIKLTGLDLQSITYNTVISACAKSRKMSICEDLFQMMKDDGFSPDRFTYSSMLNGYRKIRDWDSMFKVIREMKENKIHLDAVIYSTVIGACADAGKPKKAFELFDEMKANGIMPNEVVYSCVLRACETVKQVDSLLTEMTNNGIKKNPVVLTSAINVCHKVGGVENAIRWFDQMLEEGIKPDWVAFMSLFEVLCMADEMELLDEYYQQGVDTGVLCHLADNGPKGHITVDLHGWSIALAKAALRNVMQEYQATFERCSHILPLTILTGKGFSKNQPILRPAVAKMLQSDFSPPLNFDFEDNGIQISKKTIIEWIRSQDEQDKQERQASVLEEMLAFDDLDYNFQHLSLNSDYVMPIGHPIPIDYPVPMTARSSILFDESFIPPTHVPRARDGREFNRWIGEGGEVHPLMQTHPILGRDESPPVSYVQTQLPDFKQQFLQNAI